MKLQIIEKELKIGIPSLKMQSLANMIRETLLSLSHYLCTNNLRMEKDIKKDDLKKCF